MDLLALTIMALLVLLLCLGMVLYLRDLQRRYYEISAGAIGLVDEIRIRETRTFAGAAEPAATRSIDGGPAPDAASRAAPLTIEGSKTLVLGSPSSPFTVAAGLAEVAESELHLRWSVSPAGAGTVVAGDDERSVRVIAAVPGVLRVEAVAVTADGAVTQRGSFEAVAVAARTTTLELPWVGQGIGSFVIATLVLGITLYLGYVGVLDGAVIATLLTAVAGYVFGLNAAGGRG